MMQYIVFTISSANVTATHITHSLFFPLGVREPQTGCQVAQATLQSKTWQTCLTVGRNAAPQGGLINLPEQSLPIVQISYYFFA